MAAVPAARLETEVALGPRPRRRSLTDVLGRDYRLGLLFVSPIFALVLGLVAYPFCYAVYLSLTHKLVGMPPIYVGLDNYVRLASDGFFQRAVYNSALFTFGSVGVKLVLAAKDVPVGGYALDFLARASKLPDYTEAYSPTVLANVKSYEENVKAVLSKVALGEADAGIVYTSDIALDSADKVGRLDIPDVLNTIAAYPIATIKDSQHADLAKKFVEYVLSPDAQQILVKYGFIAV